MSTNLNGLNPIDKSAMALGLRRERKRRLSSMALMAVSIVAIAHIHVMLSGCGGGYGGTNTTPSPGNGHFSTLAPGSALPSESDCAARVRRSSWEPRADNATANNINVYAQGGRLTGSYLNQYGYESRVTGNLPALPMRLFSGAPASGASTKISSGHNRSRKAIGISPH